MNYIQNKFGLMKDENEGFSKLMVEVLEAGNKDMKDENMEVRIENIIELIGDIFFFF